MKASHCLTEMADALAVSKSGFFAHQRKRERLEPTGQRIIAGDRADLCDQPQDLWQSTHHACVAQKRVALWQKSHRPAHALTRPARQAKTRFRAQTTRSDHKLPVAPNWLARIPKPDRPGQVWLADITCIQTQEGWLYLSGILDHCSRRCIGWHAQESLASSLVSRAWEKACLNQPLAPGCSIIPIAAFSTPASNFKRFCTLVARPLP